MSRRDPVKLTDPRAIRALAHPARLSVIEELYGGRELTATECAEIAGLSPSAMSYHLRSLERAGIVERAESEDGRERPWRAAGSYLQIESESVMVEASAVSAIVLTRLGDQYQEWMRRRPREDAMWQQASTIASGQFWLTAEELAEYTKTVDRLIDLYHERQDGDRADGARRVRIAVFAFPSDEPPG